MNIRHFKKIYLLVASLSNTSPEATENSKDSAVLNLMRRCRGRLLKVSEKSTFVENSTHIPTVLARATAFAPSNLLVSIGLHEPIYFGISGAWIEAECV